MSLLPQRKKSPEEIAKLREDLGIPTSLPAEPQATPPDPPTITPAAQGPELHPSLAETPRPAPAHRAPKPVHSLKRSERIPTVPPAEPTPTPQDAADLAPVTLSLKPVRSLKKSEQAAHWFTPPATPPPDSNLPYHRHSEQEIQEIRRREALAMLPPAVNPKRVAAHPALLVPGYLLALAGAVAIHFYQQPLAVSAPFAAASLLIAVFIAYNNPISRHHAAFIAVISLFVIVFGALHYFPQLRHGT